MFIDIKGKVRQKVGLHNHTTLTDGLLSPDEVFAIYQKAGYDAMTLTDHWLWHPAGRVGNMTLLSGIEYNIGGFDGTGFVRGEGVYHITGIGCVREPDIEKKPKPNAEQIARGIRAAGGLAVLAHPAWSLNDPSVVAGLDCFDATEIYNTVSGVHHSHRPDSSAFCDLLACRGVYLPLIAADDAHYYDNDATVAFVCVESEDNSRDNIISALKAGKFYASQGPEVHTSFRNGVYSVDCTPADTVMVFSNFAFKSGRVGRGGGITHMEYEPDERERFLRAEVIDADGKHAWSNFTVLGK